MAAETADLERSRAAVVRSEDGAFSIAVAAVVVARGEAEAQTVAFLQRVGDALGLKVLAGDAKVLRVNPFPGEAAAVRALAAVLVEELPQQLLALGTVSHSLLQSP